MYCMFACKLFVLAIWRSLEALATLAGDMLWWPSFVITSFLFLVHAHAACCNLHQSRSDVTRSDALSTYPTVIVTVIHSRVRLATLRVVQRVVILTWNLQCWIQDEQIRTIIISWSLQLKCKLNTGNGNDNAAHGRGYVIRLSSVSGRRAVPPRRSTDNAVRRLPSVVYSRLHQQDTTPPFAVAVVSQVKLPLFCRRRKAHRQFVAHFFCCFPRAAANAACRYF